MFIYYFWGEFIFWLNVCFTNIIAFAILPCNAGSLFFSQLNIVQSVLGRICCLLLVDFVPLGGLVLFIFRTYSPPLSFQSPRYRAVVQDGSNTYARREVGIAQCGVVACKDENLSSCIYR